MRLELTNSNLKTPVGRLFSFPVLSPCEHSVPLIISISLLPVFLIKVPHLQNTPGLYQGASSENQCVTVPPFGWLSIAYSAKARTCSNVFSSDRSSFENHCASWSSSLRTFIA